MSTQALYVQDWYCGHSLSEYNSHKYKETKITQQSALKGVMAPTTEEN